MATKLNDVSDEKLLAELEQLVETERQLGAQVLVHLCEVQSRRLHLTLGYSSLFTYCVEALKLPRAVAYKRMQAAKVIARVPEAAEYLAAGDLCVSSLVLLGPHVESKPELVHESRGLSYRAVRRRVAELDAHPVTSDAKMTPVAGNRVRLELIVSRETVELIQSIQDLDRHIDPSGDVVALVTRSLRFYRKARRRSRFAESSGATSSKTTRRSDREGGGLATPEGGEELNATTSPISRRGRAVPAAVRRAVLARDQEQCTFVGKDGHRCTETSFLEFDHEHPIALGGDHRSIRLLCRAHNQHTAELAFGAGYMRSRRHPERALSSFEERGRLVEQATQAISNAGFFVAESREAVIQAFQESEGTPALEDLVRRALSKMRAA